MRTRRIAVFICFIMPVLFVFFQGCSHIPKPKNPFGGKEKKKEKENVVVIGGIKYIKVPVRDKSGKITGYRYIRKGGGTFTPTTYRPPRKSYVPPQTAARPAVPYYKRYGMTEEVTRKTATRPTMPQKKKTTYKMVFKKGIRKKVVVLSFIDKTDYKEEGWGKVVPQKIEELLEGSGKIRIVDEEEVESVVGTKNKKILLTPQNLIKIGQLFSVQAVIDGEVTGIYISKRRERSFDVLPVSIALARIEIRIYDTLSGNLLRSFTETNSFFLTEESGKFSDEKARLKAINLVVKKAAKDILSEIALIPWWSRVSGVSGNKVYINSGKLSGVEIGQILTVREKGKEVIDQATKKIMGVSFGKERAKIRVVDYLGVDGAVCEEISGDGIRTNDIVTLK